MYFQLFASLSVTQRALRPRNVSEPEVSKSPPRSSRTPLSSATQYSIPPPLPSLTNPGQRKIFSLTPYRVDAAGSATLSAKPAPDIISDEEDEDEAHDWEDWGEEGWEDKGPLSGFTESCGPIIVD